MKTHDDYREALALHALGSLEDYERREVESHLETCPPCAIELGELRETTSHLIHGAAPVEPSPRLLGEILGALDSPAAFPAAAPGVVQTRPPRRQWRQFLGSRPVVWTARFAVALVVLVLAFSQVNLLVRLDRAYAEIARMREIGEFVTSPGVTLVPLWGTEAARGAHAKLAYEHATGRFMMFSSHMPAPPAGKRYQLWVIADRVRPVGAFSLESQNGTLAPPVGNEPFYFGMSLEPEEREVDEPSGGMILMGGPLRYPRPPAGEATSPSGR